jgi:hypothetical protein
VKRRLAILSAVCLTGLVLLGWQVARMSRAAAEKDGRAQWGREAARWRTRAEDALAQKVSPATAGVLSELLADAQRLRGEKPARANESEFRFAAARVEAFAEKVNAIDWGEVIKWEREVQAAGETMGRALVEAKSPEEERAAVRAAETRLQELRAGRPWGADDEPAEEVRRMIGAARANLSPGQR